MVWSSRYGSDELQLVHVLCFDLVTVRQYSSSSKPSIRTHSKIGKKVFRMNLDGDVDFVTQIEQTVAARSCSSERLRFGEILVVLRPVRSSVFGLRSSVFGLRSSVFGLRSSVFGFEHTTAYQTGTVGSNPRSFGVRKILQEHVPTETKIQLRMRPSVIAALLWLHAGINLCYSHSTSSPQWLGGANQGFHDDAGIQVPDASPETVKTNLNDPIRGVNIVYPVDGAIEVSPVVFQVQINVLPGEEKAFAAQYEDVSFCVEANGVTIFCSRLDEPTYHYHQLGNCTARAYLTVPGVHEVKTRTLSPPVSFSLVNQTEFEANVARQVQKNDEKHRLGFQLSLVEWAQMQQRQPDKAVLQKLEQDARIDGIEANETKSSELLLVIGVRTAVVSHFHLRQAIRETWASPSVLPQGVKVVFLGCRPYAVVPDEVADSSYEEESNLRRTWETIELEKLVYGDLLTDELDCDDAYVRLADKTKEFLHLAVTRYSNAQYVMIADDDLYLRLDKIAGWLRRLGPRERFYVGRVREIENARKTSPIRIPESPHYLTEDVYPLSELPPFALGANFFLSMDCARFVSKNRRRLRDLGGMDDISVSLWMLTRQVHPMHRGGLQYLRSGPCRDTLVALSDLSASAIRLIHANILSQRAFCHGFDRHVWMWENGSGGLPKGSPRLLSVPREVLHFDLAFARPKQRAEELVVTISTRSHAGVKFSYFPPNETVAAYSRKLCAQARLYFPGAVSTCAIFTEQIRSALHLFYDDLAVDNVAKSHFAEWEHVLR